MQDLDSISPKPKQSLQEISISPGFYKTDLEQLTQTDTHAFAAEFDAAILDLEVDHSQNIFVRDDRFNQSWDQIQGEKRTLLISLLQLYCEAEYAGFVLYKELAFELKEKNPKLAKGFALMSRDEARHAGFLNKCLLDFGLKPKLTFLNREERQYIKLPFAGFIYSTYLSEKLSSCYYQTLFNHLQNHPEHSIYPIFDYYPSWGDDENRHGNFFGAIIQANFNSSRKIWNRWICKFYLITAFSMSYAKHPENQKLLNFLGLEAREYSISTIRKVNQAIQSQTSVTLDLEDSRFFKSLDVYLDIMSKNKRIKSSNESPFLKIGQTLLNYFKLIQVVLGLSLVKAKISSSSQA